MGPDEAWLARCRKRMADIDALSPDLRALVHEFGWTVVDAFLKAGVERARTIRHLIKTVKDGSSAFGNGTKGEKMRQIP